MDYKDIKILKLIPIEISLEENIKYMFSYLYLETEKCRNNRHFSHRNVDLIPNPYIIRQILNSKSVITDQYMIDINQINIRIQNRIISIMTNK